MLADFWPRAGPPEKAKQRLKPHIRKCGIPPCLALRPKAFQDTRGPLPAHGFQLPAAEREERRERLDRLLLRPSLPEAGPLQELADAAAIQEHHRRSSLSQKERRLPPELRGHARLPQIECVFPQTGRLWKHADARKVIPPVEKTRRIVTPRAAARPQRKRSFPPRLCIRPLWGGLSVCPPAMFTLYGNFDSGSVRNWRDCGLEPVALEGVIFNTPLISFESRPDNCGTEAESTAIGWFNFVIRPSFAWECPFVRLLWANCRNQRRLAGHRYRGVYRFLSDFDSGFAELQDDPETRLPISLPAHDERPFSYSPWKAEATDQGLSFLIPTPLGAWMNLGADLDAKANAGALAAGAGSVPATPYTQLRGVELPAAMRGAAIQVSFSFPYSLAEARRQVEDAALSCPRLEPPLRIGAGAEVHRFCADPGNPIVLITCRCHSGETPGSYVLDGILTALPRLLQYVQVWVVPALNPGALFQGNYRSDLQGRNMNRLYTSQAPEGSSAKGVIDLVRSVGANPGTRPLGREESGGAGGEAADSPLVRLQKALTSRDQKRSGGSAGKATGSAAGNARGSSGSGSAGGRPPTGRRSAPRLPLSHQPLSQSQASSSPASPRSKRSTRSNWSTHSTRSTRSTRSSLSSQPTRSTRSPLSSASSTSGLAESSAPSDAPAVPRKSLAFEIDAGELARPGNFKGPGRLSSVFRDTPVKSVPPLAPAPPATGAPIVFILDLHAHASIPNAFLLGNSTYDLKMAGGSKPDAERLVGQVRNVLFLHLLAGANSLVDLARCDFRAESMTKNDPGGESSEGTMRVGMFALTELPNIYTFEAHYYRSERGKLLRAFGVSDFRRMGADIAGAMLAMFSLDADAIRRALRRVDAGPQLGVIASGHLLKARSALIRSYPDLLCDCVMTQLRRQFLRVQAQPICEAEGFDLSGEKQRADAEEIGADVVES